MIKMLMLAANLIQEAGLGDVGVDLFIGTMPADVLYGVMLRGGFVGATVDEGMDGFYDTEFQVVVRDIDVLRGYERCEAISKALRANRLQRDGLCVSWMRRAALPVTYPKGAMDDVETSCRINVGYGELP